MNDTQKLLKAAFGNEEFAELCRENDCTPAEVLTAFINDLCELRQSNGANEREAANRWFDLVFRWRAESVKRGEEKPLNNYRVELVNVQTVGAHCGYGEGRTLEEAQQAALELAKQSDPNAVLSATGYQVLFSGGVNC